MLDCGSQPSFISALSNFPFLIPFHRPNFCFLQSYTNQYWDLFLWSTTCQMGFFFLSRVSYRCLREERASARSWEGWNNLDPNSTLKGLIINDNCISLHLSLKSSMTSMFHLNHYRKEKPNKSNLNALFFAHHITDAKAER